MDDPMTDLEAIRARYEDNIAAGFTPSTAWANLRRERWDDYAIETVQGQIANEVAASWMGGLGWEAGQ